MVKFLLGFVTALVLVFLTFVLMIFALLRFREKPPLIADNSVLVLGLEGDIPEKAPVELPALLGGGRPGTTVASVWNALRMAAADAHIRAVVVEPDRLMVGWAKTE